MKTLLSATAALSLILSAAVADAKPGRGGGNGNGKGNGNGRGAWAGEVHCPPGLRDRSPACVPPGQARAEERRDEAADRQEEHRHEDEHRHEEEERDEEREVVLDDSDPEPEDDETDWAGESDAEPDAERAEAVAAAAAILDVLRQAPAREADATLPPAYPWLADPAPVEPAALDVEPPAPETASPVVMPSPLPSPLPEAGGEPALTDIFQDAAGEGSTGY